MLPVCVYLPSFKFKGRGHILLIFVILLVKNVCIHKKCNITFNTYHMGKD